MYITQDDINTIAKACDAIDGMLEVCDPDSKVDYWLNVSDSLGNILQKMVKSYDSQITARAVQKRKKQILNRFNN
jgi:hypothetical protein